MMIAVEPVLKVSTVVVKIRRASLKADLSTGGWLTRGQEESRNQHWQ